MDVIGQLGAPAAFPQIKIPDTHLVSDWVAILAEPDAVRMSKNILLFIRNRATVGLSARSVIAVPNLILWIRVETVSERFCFVNVVIKMWLT
jgi:hypothetical protein